MKLLIALFLITIPSVFGGMPWIIRTPEEAIKIEAPAPTTCNMIALQACQSNFNTALNISNNLDWHVPFDLTFALQNIFTTQGVRGIINICNAYTLMSQCLGLSYPVCINPLFFLGNGMGIASATFYPGILAQLHFQCGGGLETILANWGCIGPQQVAANITIQQCLAQYALNSLANPSMACTYAQQLLSCVRLPFGNNCNAPSSWAICESFRSSVATHLPYCNSLRCVVGAALTGDEQLPAQHDSPLKTALEQLGGGLQGQVYRDISKHAKEAQAKIAKKQA